MSAPTRPQPAVTARGLPFERPRTLFCVDDNFRCQTTTRRAGLALQRPAAILPYLTGAEVEDVLITAADPRALAPSGTRVVVPRGTDRLDVGVSLGVVMSADGGMVAGYVAALDVVQPQVPAHQTYLARSFPTHKVVSARLASRPGRDARLQLLVDGVLRQDSTLDRMIADVDVLLETIRAHHPLDGAVVLTGSPGGRPADTTAGSQVVGLIGGVGTVRAQLEAE